MRRWSTVLILTAVGCAANPGIVEMSPGTYMLFRQDKAGIFGNAVAMKAAAINEANAFAARKGKVAIPISMKDTPLWPGHFASFDYQFKLVAPDDPAAKSTPMIQRADVVLEQNEHKSVDVHSTTNPTPPDVYTQLVKIDDLRQRGILTEAEFQAEKAKILTGK